MTTIQNIKLTRIRPGHYEFRSTFDGARPGELFVWSVFQDDDGDWSDHPLILDANGECIGATDSLSDDDRYPRYRDIKAAIESSTVRIGVWTEFLGSYSVRLDV